MKVRYTENRSGTNADVEVEDADTKSCRNGGDGSISSTQRLTIKERVLGMTTNPPLVEGAHSAVGVLASTGDVISKGGTACGVLAASFSPSQLAW
jgi:hypothetical protein